MRKKLLATLASAIVLFGGASSANADATTLKIGTLAPPDSPWGQVFKVWQQGVDQRSGGNLKLQFFWNGQQGDDVAMVAKIRSGQLDGAAISAAGLGQIYKQVLVLQMPGLFREWAKLDAARNAMRPGFDAEFDKQGFKVLGWGDIGRAHSMSKGFAIRTPADLKHKNTFYLPGDPIGPMVFTVVGDITPKQVAVPEILPGLTNGTINVITAPALVAEQLQWSSRLDHMGDDVGGIGIGALVFAAPKIANLPADAREILTDTGKIAGEALTRRIRAEDDAVFARLQGRMTHYSLTDAEKEEWKKVFIEVGKRLRGTVFQTQLVDDAVKYAQ